MAAPRPPADAFKRPESVLVVVYTTDGGVLLLQRVDAPEFWQSVTGAMTWEEVDPQQTARRELFEETGLSDVGALVDLHCTHRFPILPKWRHRYAPDVTENIEHAFALQLHARAPIRLNPAEHQNAQWLSFAAAAARASSWTNRVVIEQLATDANNERAG